MISRLRRIPVSVVEASTTHVGLDPTVRVDVRTLEASLRNFVGDRLDNGVPELRRERRVLTDLLAAGDLLPDWYDDWIADERERLHELRLYVLDEIADELMDAEQFDLAATAAVAAVRAEPLRESSQRRLIKLHITQGNHADALRCYRAYCRRLRREEGVSPSKGLAELVVPGESG